MRNGKPRLAFISPVFLFPNDAGGKIRSTNVLRGMKGGAFDITLASPASAEQALHWAEQLGSVCDEFIAWQPARNRPTWLRGLDLFDALPINIVPDRTGAGCLAVESLADREDLDLIVFDFVHSSVLRPPGLAVASVCFTHNVEAEIFGRHAAQARNPFTRWLWSSQHGKMRWFERDALRRFTSVIAVSERDALQFCEAYNVAHAEAIPTGVDLDFFSWQAPPESGTTTPTVVFTGSMNWTANIDGVQFFIDEVWPHVLAAKPNARFVVVGRDPPVSLVNSSRKTPNVVFTGFVDDVRPHVHSAHVFVIPLRVGGGTRIKAFEAMAMGCPVASTSIGMEGLDVEVGRHFLCRDDPLALADAILSLLTDGDLRRALSRQARQLVEDRFGHQVAASVFERICLDAMKKHKGPAALA